MQCVCGSCGEFRKSAWAWFAGTSEDTLCQRCGHQLRQHKGRDPSEGVLSATARRYLNQVKHNHGTVVLRTAEGVAWKQGLGVFSTLHVDVLVMIVNRLSLTSVCALLQTSSAWNLLISAQDGLWRKACMEFPWKVRRVLCCVCVSRARVGSNCKGQKSPPVEAKNVRCCWRAYFVELCGKEDHILYRLRAEKTTQKMARGLGDLASYPALSMAKDYDPFGFEVFPRVDAMLKAHTATLNALLGNAAPVIRGKLFTLIKTLQQGHDRLQVWRQEASKLARDKPWNTLEKIRVAHYEPLQVERVQPLRTLLQSKEQAIQQRKTDSVEHTSLTLKYQARDMRARKFLKETATLLRDGMKMVNVRMFALFVTVLGFIVGRASLGWFFGWFCVYHILHGVPVLLGKGRVCDFLAACSTFVIAFRIGVCESALGISRETAEKNRLAAALMAAQSESEACIADVRRILTTIGAPKRQAVALEAFLEKEMAHYVQRDRINPDCCIQ